MSTKRSPPGASRAPRAACRRERQVSHKARESAIRSRLALARDHVYWASGIVTFCAYAMLARLAPEPDRRSGRICP